MGWLRNIARAGGNALGQLTPNLSIKGHKFSLDPSNALKRVASSALQGGDVREALDEERKSAWRTGAVGAAAYGGASLLGAGAGGAGAGTAGTFGGGALPVAGTLGAGGGLAPIAAGVGGVPAAITGANAGIGGTSALSAGGGLLGKIGGFIGKHPGAVGGALSAAGQIGQSGSENRLRDAQGRALEQETANTAEDRERRRRQDAAMEPLRQALALSLARSAGRPQAQVASNPYLQQGG